jgi:transposase
LEETLHERVAQRVDEDRDHHEQPQTRQQISLLRVGERRSRPPTLPMKNGRAGTMTHDYKRNGTTTLFAALDVLKSEVIGRCMPQHRHQEFLKFLKTIDRSTPRHMDIHCIADNYATHKKQEVKDWLAAHKRLHLHFIPTSSSWLNLVERWFGKITAQRIRRSMFTSVPQLERAIYDYIDRNNADPKPFV